MCACAAGSLRSNRIARPHSLSRHRRRDRPLKSSSHLRARWRTWHHIHACRRHRSWPRPPYSLSPSSACRCSHEHGYGSRPRFPSELLEDWNNIYSAFCKHPLGEWSALRRCLATVTLPQQLLALLLILASCSLFLNFPSCDSLRKPCAAKASRQLLLFIIHVPYVIFFFFPTLQIMNRLIFMHDIYFF